MYSYYGMSSEDFYSLVKELFGDISCTGSGSCSCEKSIVSTIIKNDEEGAVVEYELPGYKKEEVSVNVEENILVIKVDGKKGKKTINRKLSKTADVSNISATHEDGILTITIPCLKKNVVTVAVK